MDISKEIQQPLFKFSSAMAKVLNHHSAFKFEDYPSIILGYLFEKSVYKESDGTMEIYKIPELYKLIEK